MKTSGSAIQKKIREMVNRIVKMFHPDRIILFGSQADGRGGPDSDVDLLVVMDVPGSKREARLDIRRSLRGIGIPKDVVVCRPEEFVQRKEIVGTIEYPAAREGRVLYARP